MQIVSLAPVPVASRLWRYSGQSWSLAIVCKITVRLEAGQAVLAKSHDPIHEQEITAGAAGANRLHAPADLVPSRAGVDITLVGDAYALGARGPLSARLQIASVDKEVHFHPKAPVVRAPEAFAPLAASAAARRTLLAGAPTPAHDSLPLVLPPDFNLGYFNSAPPDQRVDELPAGALLRLEHLHPKSRLLLTQLPDVMPQVFVQRGRRRHELGAQLDALWIDSQRGLATMTWHCQVPLSAQNETGRVWVTVAGPGRRMSAAQLSTLIQELGGRDDAETTTPPPERQDPLGRTTAIRRPPTNDAEDEPEDGQDATGILLPKQSNSGKYTSAMALLNPDQALGAAPSWLSRNKKEPSTTPAPTKSTFKNITNVRTPPLPKRGKRMTNTASLPAARRARALHAMQAAGRTPDAATPTAPPPATPSRPNNLRPSPRSAQQAQLAKASAAQVEQHKATTSKQPSPETTPKAAAKPRRRTRPIDLLWFDRDATLAIRNRWQSLSTELDFAPRDRLHDLPTDDPQLAREHHTHFGLLAQLPTTDRASLRQLMQQSVTDDGRFTAPLCALEGQLQISFDDAESLRALVAAMKPFSDQNSKLASKTDSKLTAALEHASAVLDQTSATTNTLISAQRRVRDAFEQSSPAASLDVVNQAVERTLLEQRHYACRTLLGDKHIRATLSCGKHQLVCYLNEALQTRLPLMMSFDVRIIAEAHPRQDQYESADYALRVLTLGRLIQL
ncbi:MAG TPA: DUF2169 domain-containing protein [Sorangium sp.]|nr:DUF2169 domain-containing protein [Sorangium sp.]